MNRSRTLLFAWVLVFAAAPRIQASFDRKTIVQSVADQVEELYVDPKTGKALAEHLRQRLAQGAFESCSAPAALADALTRALREVADDKHLNVRAGGEDAAAPHIRIRRPAPGDGEPEPSGARRVIVGPGERPAQAPDRAPARSGVARVERLEGNVGYLAVSGFYPGERNREALASAMNLLEDADALIVDVGQCPGGAPGSVVFLESYFFGPEPKELMSRYDRPSDRTDHEFTLKELPGRRRPEVPLWILAGPDTGSACESFAYTLQKHGRASVVGARTAGAGYNNVLVPVGDGFTLSVSVAKPIHPKTGGGWEGTGVLPDVPAPAGRALSTAHREALSALLSRATPRRPALQWALEANRARENGAPTVPLAAYSGSYGAREVTVADGRLFYRSPSGRLFGPLLPVARDAFLLPDVIRIQFERGSDGSVTALSLERPDGIRERVEKGSPAGATASPCTISGVAVSAPVEADQVQDDWKAWLDTRAAGFSGVALIARGDAVQIVSAHGLADRSANRRNTAQTRFNLGSINKTFTAIAVAQLIQQGKLSLDDTLAKYIPDYPNREAAARITIHQLLTHRSGIATFMRTDFGDASSVEEMTKVVGSQPQSFEPGARQEYSNGGYVVLGRVVEVVSGRSYTTYVSDHIYRPAGMTSSGFARKGENDPAIAMGYFSTDAQGHPVMGGQTGLFGFNPPEPGNPAGGGYSTAADLFKFSRALRGGRLLDQRMTDYLLNGTFSGQSGPKFGFALREQMAGTRRFIGNGGGAPGVNSEFRFEPAGDSTVIVLANSSPPAATKLLGDILDRLGSSGAAPNPQPPASTSPIRSEVQGLHAEMIAAFQEKPANVARYYATDARILGGGRRVSGGEIAAYWSQITDATSWALEIVDAGGSRDEPWILGRSTLTRQSGQRMVTDYLAILRRDADGKLKYSIDMFTAAARQAPENQ